MPLATQLAIRKDDNKQQFQKHMYKSQSCKRPQVIGFSQLECLVRGVGEYGCYLD